MNKIQIDKHFLDYIINTYFSLQIANSIQLTLQFPMLP